MVTAGGVLGSRYRIEEQIASGGMGTVYRAMDERLNRLVAVKVLRDDLARDDRFIERFRREARSAASLSHPNVAAVYDYGKDEETHFIVMDFVDGSDLARVVRETAPLDPVRAAVICAQICDALAHAHERGVVHRDIKPGNVMVATDGDVKVTDFGIARASGESTLTATGSVLGTAQYISPEQANGLPANEASDIYAVGIVLYEMLTGTVPFTGDSAVAVAMRHLRENVPNPSALNSRVNARLDEVVARATQKEPAARYSSAALMASALRALTGAGGDTAVIPVAEAEAASTVAIRAAPPLARRAAVVSIAALLGLALVAAVLVFARADEAPPERRRPRGAAGTGAPAVATPAASSMIEVPSLIGWSRKDAEDHLKELGLKAEATSEGEESFLHERDTVYATDPIAGTPLPPGQTITLFVGTADPEEEEMGDEEDFVPPGQEKKEKKEHDD